MLLILVRRDRWVWTATPLSLTDGGSQKKLIDKNIMCSSTQQDLLHMIDPVRVISRAIMGVKHGHRVQFLRKDHSNAS